MKKAALPILIIAFLSACSNQRLSTDEHDDLYYSSSDRFNDQPSEFNQVDDVSGEDYLSKDDYERAAQQNDSYFVVGRESKDVNPNASGAYADQSAAGFSTDTQAAGMTINNFYGSTNYYESDDDVYYDDSYATRIRRFNTGNVYSNYGYYDPFFVDPYWNWGWGYYNPYPVSGWQFGWNSWNGWNVSYNWGWNSWNYWGSPYYGNNWGWNSWNNCGWGYNPRWGYNNWNGWGNGAYNAGYWNGYNDGFNDGYYGYNGWYSTNNQYGRGTSVGRRDLVTDRGFNDPSRVPVTEGQTQAKGSKINPSTYQASNQSGSVGVVDRVVKDDAKVKGSFAPAQSASETKLQNISSIYTPSKGKTINPAYQQSQVNDKAAKAASQYSSTNVTTKYQSKGVRRTPEKVNRYQGNTASAQKPAKQVRTNSAQPNSINRGTKRSIGSSQPQSSNRGSSYNKPAKTSRSVSTPRSTGTYSAPSKSSQSGRTYSQPSKPSKNVGTPSRSTRPSAQPSSRSRSYSTPSSKPSRSSYGGRSSSGSSRSSKPNLSPSSRSSSSFGGAKRSSSSRSSGGSKPSLRRR